MSMGAEVSGMWMAMGSVSEGSVSEGSVFQVGQIDLPQLGESRWWSRLRTMVFQLI